MKSFGIALIVIGVVWAIFAFNISTAVDNGYGGQVNNIGLMADRQNHLIFSGLTILLGVILFGFGSNLTNHSTTSENKISCPFCAEDIKAEAKICKHCGKDIPQPTEPKVNANLELPPTIVSKQEIEKGGYIRCNNCSADNKVSYKKCFRCDAAIIIS